MSFFGICISYVVKCVFTSMFKHFYWGTVDKINCPYLKSFASWSLLLPPPYTTTTLPCTIICFPARGWSNPLGCYEFVGGTLVPMASSQGPVKLRSLCPYSPVSCPPGAKRPCSCRGLTRARAGRRKWWPRRCGYRAHSRPPVSTGSSPSYRTETSPVPPVQCHSAPPGLLIMAAWERPAGGGPGVWVKGQCGPPLPIRHAHLCLAFHFISRTFWREVLNFDQAQLNSFVLFCFQWFILFIS